MLSWKTIRDVKNWFRDALSELLVWYTVGFGDDADDGVCMVWGLIGLQECGVVMCKCNFGRVA